MKFYIGRIVYPNLSYEQKSQLEAACREENENGWGVYFPGCYIVVVKVTYTHISIVCAIQEVKTKESDVKKKIAVMASEIGEKSSLPSIMNLGNLFHDTGNKKSSEDFIDKFFPEKHSSDEPCSDEVSQNKYSSDEPCLDEVSQNKYSSDASCSDKYSSDKIYSNKACSNNPSRKEDFKKNEKYMNPIRLEEATLNAFMAVMNDYSLESLFPNKDVLLEKIGLELNKKYAKEYLLGTEYWDRKSQVFDNGFLENEEKKRIAKGKKFSRPMVQPLHYVIYEKDTDVLKSMVQELLYHLCRKGRILNRRLVKVDETDQPGIAMGREIRNLNLLDGGCVVIYIKENNSPKVIKDLLAGVFGNKNRYNGTYTVIVILPDKLREKKFLKEFVPEWVFIEVCKQYITAEEAKEFFQDLMQKDNLCGACDGWENLFSERTQYSRGDVISQYEYWLKNIYYIDNYFPQYKNIIEEYAQEKSFVRSAKEELQGLIGLTEVKNLITDIIDFFKLQKIREQVGGSVNKPTMHMVFYGNPGTAKTTVARLVGRILKEENIIEKGDIYEVGRADLVGKYVGWTARIVEDYFERARGSVLFIDEAYALADEQKSFGDEAINTLVQKMEIHREDVVVIMAGYQKSMEHLLQKNQGLQSRIAFYITFPDYSIDELYQILERMVEAEGLKLAEDVWDPFCDKVIQVDIHQGNGRAVRNILDRAKINQAKRVLKLPEQKQKEELFLMRKEDFI